MGLIMSCNGHFGKQIGQYYSHLSPLEVKAFSVPCQTLWGILFLTALRRGIERFKKSTPVDIPGQDSRDEMSLSIARCLHKIQKLGFREFIQHLVLLTGRDLRFTDLLLGLDLCS